MTLFVWLRHAPSLAARPPIAPDWLLSCWPHSHRQSEVMWVVHGRWLLRIPFLRHAPRHFMAELSLLLDAHVFAPGELAPPGWLYIVHRGIALFAGRVLTSGRTWGLDSIISDPT